MSIVDIMADQLSEKTGAKFIVDRIPRRPGSGLAPSWRYRIRVSFSGHSISFGETSVQEAKRTLAMIGDLIAFGFIKIEKQ